jgi:hypothetical protein
VQGIGDPALITQAGGIFCNHLSSLSFNISGTGAGIVTDPFGIFGNPSVQAVGFERGVNCGSSDWRSARRGRVLHGAGHVPADDTGLPLGRARDSQQRGRQPAFRRALGSGLRHTQHDAGAVGSDALRAVSMKRRKRHPKR